MVHLLMGTFPVHCTLSVAVIAGKLGPSPLLSCCRLGNPEGYFSRWVTLP